MSRQNPSDTTTWLFATNKAISLFLTANRQVSKMRASFGTGMLVAILAMGMLSPADSAFSGTPLIRTSAFNPTLSWACRQPADDEKSSMIALGNPNFGISKDYDPVGITGGCMPDATCNSNGVSSWTNVFGYVRRDDIFTNGNIK